MPCSTLWTMLLIMHRKINAYRYSLSPRLSTNNFIITVIILSVFIVGCATGEKVRMSIHEGMTKDVIIGAKF